MSILADILATKEGELSRARAERPQSELEAECRGLPAVRDLAAALRRPAGEVVRVIAEIKRASPSAGPIRAGAVPEDIAREYQDGGATALSVLTDASYFDGHLSFLPRVRATVELPLLRKDFVIDAYQVYEARAARADAVLLIVAALDGDRLGELIAATREIGVGALVEVHSEAEAERALSCGARLLGVNHRDLRSFTIDLGLSARLARMVPDDVVRVAESGLRTADDLRAMGDAGADAVLIGETLMRAPSPGAALRELLEGAA